MSERTFTATDNEIFSSAAKTRSNNEVLLLVSFKALFHFACVDVHKLDDVCIHAYQHVL